VLLAATVDVAKRKKDVSSEVMDARELGYHVVALGCVLRSFK